jgi:hypothetical protein
MLINDYLRLIAGCIVIISVLLGYAVSPYFYLLTLFVGINLFQSAFTKRCPMITLLRRLGVPEYPEKEHL